MRKNPALTINVDNMHIQTALSRVGHAINKLSAQGFTVSRIDIDQQSRPTIVVQNDAHCRRYQESRRAVRYGFGHDEQGAYEKYQFQLYQCRIAWEVR